MTASDAISFRSESQSTSTLDGIPVAEAVDYDNPKHEKYMPRMRLLVLPKRREDGFDRWFWPMVAIGVASLYLFALLSFWGPAHSGTDQNGYFVGGRQFASTFSSGLKPESDYGFIGRMWIMADNGVNYPKYPLGLPILFAACLWIFGEARGVEVAHLLSPIGAALATLGVFAITRRLAGGFIGVMAMLLLACGQTMLTLAINPNSHALCTAAVVWGIYFLIRWLETGTIWRGVVTGLLLGFAYMIRYTEGLLVLPIGVAMLYAARWQLPALKRLFFTLGGTALFAVLLLGGAWLMRDTQAGWLKPLGEDNGKPLKLLATAISFAAIASMFIEWRSLARALSVGIAWLVPVAYLTLFNMVAMYSFTSYAGTNESTGFQWSFFEANWEKMIRVIHDQGVFFIAPLGVLGLICMFRRLPLVATILTLWFVPSVLLYTAYYWAPDNMGVSYSRFILTQLPVLVIAGAWLLGEIARRGRHGAVGRIAIGAIVFVSCSLGLWRSLLGSEWGQRIMVRANIEIQARQNMNLAGLGREVRRAINGPKDEAAARKVKDDSDVILFGDGERLNHLQWIGGWQLLSVDAFNYERSGRIMGRVPDENDPDPIDPSRTKFLQKIYKGKDQRSLQADQNKLIANSLDSGKRVFFVLPDNSAKQFGRQIDRRQFDVKNVGTYNDVPSPRLEDDFLLHSERPKQPVNRFGRGNAFGGPNFLGNEKMLYRIGQVVKKPATPATTQATTEPTTQP